MAYTVSDGTTTLDVLDLDILESTNNLDQCAFMTTSKYSDNTALVVYDGATPIFYGYQKKVENRDDYDVMYNITLMEKAVEMQYVILRDSGNPAFTKTDTADNLIAFAVAAVNTAYGYSGGDAWTIDSGSSSSTSLTIGCYYTNAMAFIRKVVVDNLGYKLWFDSSTKKVYFGEYFVDRTATPIDYIKKKEIRDSNQRGCTKVTVIGSDSSVYGSSGSGNIERIFEYPSATTSTECGNLAARILSDVSVTNVQWEVVLGEGVTANVGDYIDLDGSDYIVNQKETTLDEVTITVGSTETSILETLGTSITEITGETVTGSDASWSGGNTNVAANSASYTEFTFDVKDKNVISNAVLDLTIGSFIKSADVNTTTGTLALSDSSPISSVVEYSVNDNISNGSYNYYPYDGSNRYIKSGTLSSGCQFAFSSLSINFRNPSTVVDEYVYIRIEYGYTTSGSPPSSWTPLISGQYQAIALVQKRMHNYLSEAELDWDTYSYCSPSYDGTNTRGFYANYSLDTTTQTAPTSTVAVTISAFIPGSSTSNSTLYVRWYVYPYTSGGSGINSVYNTALLQIIPRHVHTVATVYDKTTTGTPPSYLNVTINSTSIGAVTPGTTLPDITSYLTSGKNIIKIATPSGSNNQCSVNPTITYQTLGKS